MRLDELSDALHQQADTVRDGGAADRLHAVRGRVRTVRRRRTAAVSTAAVAAVAVVGLAVLPGFGDRASGPADAPATLAGHDVPPTLEANGFTYEYVEGVAGDPGENPLELQMELDDEPRLVSFASSESGSTLVADSDQGSRMGGPSGDFSTYLLLQPGGDETVTLRQLDNLGDGTLALAVYDLADETPVGVTDGRSTFRDEVAGWQLVDGVIGEPGRTDLTFTVTLPEGRLRWDTMCHSGGDDLMMKYSVEGVRGWMGSGCGDTGPLGPDAADSTSQSVGKDPSPRNRPVEVRVWLGPTDGGPAAVAADADAVLGLAVYAEAGNTVDVLGQQLEATFESAGHTWAVGTVEQMAGEDGRYRLELAASPSSRVVQIVVVHATDRPVELRHGVSGSDDDSVRIVSPDATTGATTLGPRVVLPGKERTVDLRFLKGWTPDARVAVVTSDLAD